MSKYYIVSEETNDGQTWAVTQKDGKVVVMPYEKDAAHQIWEVKFQQGKTKAGVTFVGNNGKAIAYSANNSPLTLVDFKAVEGNNNNSIWNMDSNVTQPWFLIVNPDHTWGQIWDIHGGSAGLGVPIYTWNENGNSCQRWRFQEA